MRYTEVFQKATAKQSPGLFPFYFQAIAMLPLERQRLSI